MSTKTDGHEMAASAVSAESASTAIWTRKLTKRYGDLTAVDRLDLEVQPGEVFGLLGPNGAGKTTTILMLLGLSEPTSGDVRVIGVDPSRNPIDVKRRVGYVPDSVGFYGHLTGRENLEYTAALNGLDPGAARDRIAFLLGQVGLTERGDDPVKVYSRGMRQRLGIADALVKSPDVLVLDEPTVGLDPRGAEQVLDLVDRLAKEQGVAILLSSHLLGQVQSMCTRIGIFVRGRMIAAGTVDDLAAENDGRQIVEVAVAESGADLADVLGDVPGVDRVDRDDSGWVVESSADVREAVARRLNERELTVVHLHRRSEDLWAIYRRYFAEEGSHE